MSRYYICRRVLNDPNDPATEDCGGDCLRCMAEVAEDPDCIAALRIIEAQRVVNKEQTNDA